jgi:hypothetical protein
VGFNELVLLAVGVFAAFAGIPALPGAALGVLAVAATAGLAMLAVPEAAGPPRVMASPFDLAQVARDRRRSSVLPDVLPDDTYDMWVGT